MNREALKLDLLLTSYFLLGFGLGTFLDVGPVGRVVIFAAALAVGLAGFRLVRGRWRSR